MNLDFKKGNGLIPVIVQDIYSQQVLMLGYMNEEAYQKTLSDKKVCFFSRTKNRLWTKGEYSGNYLWVEEILPDCDADSLLILVKADGPACHTGTISCFNDKPGKGFLYQLEQIIKQRIDNDAAFSYTNKLFQKGLNKVIQKVGEEAIELIIEAKDSNDDLFKNEAADLLFHFLILLKAKGFQLEDIEQVLRSRNQ